MDIIISNTSVEFNSLKPFTPNYDKVYVSAEEDFNDNNDFKFNDKNIKKLLNLVDYSWDGEIYWFQDKDKNNVLKTLDNWFSQQENHTESDDYRISNCFLIKYTPNGMCLIDTQLDMSSNINAFLHLLNQQYPDLTYEYYSDCHLIDHLKLGRQSNNNEFETLYFFYKENMIDPSFFLRGIESFTVDDNQNEYDQLLPNDKQIVITGKLACEREYVLECLNDAGYTTSDKVTENSWLWYGDKVGTNKIQAAKEKNIKVNSLDEVIEMAYQKYLDNKNRLNQKMKK